MSPSPPPSKVRGPNLDTRKLDIDLSSSLRPTLVFLNLPVPISRSWLEEHSSGTVWIVRTKSIRNRIINPYRARRVYKARQSPSKFLL